MRSHHQRVAAVVLILALAMPVAAASRPWSRTGGVAQAVRHFVVRVLTRISPPVGCPEPAPAEPTTTTTDAPTRTQTQ